MDRSPGVENAAGFRAELVHSIKQALTTRTVDSPVYLALPGLRPPRRLPDPVSEESGVPVSEATVDTPEKPPWASAVGSDEYGRYAEITIDGVRQRFRWIEPGSFEMGSPASEPGCGSDEVQHTVTLSRGFWLADTACSQAFWQAVTRSNPSDFKEVPRNPVENVSWNDAQSFVAELNRHLPGLQARLPSEAEWEYACRAGTTTPFSFGGNIWPEQVNYDGNRPYASGKKGRYRARTVPVGSLPPNAWGLYEMHGNVSEWCADWYGSYPMGAQTDPRGPQTGVYRVLRGGSWFYYGRYVRSAYRSRYVPGERSDGSGFRLALGPAGPAEPA
ncbi:MAG: formylglycine-generating enzyme family protein [Candidatus Accumulibacter sp.]|nr:formylglycine-generating enzyme family protein [Accumulibacter sp.]